MIIPGILEKDFNKVENNIRLVDNEAVVIQIDLADGKLVDGLTFQDATLLDSINMQSTLELDLMETHPLDFLHKKLNNVTRVIFHVESKDDLLEDILKAKNFDYQVGFAISPETPIEKLDPYIEYLDYVQFMTVKPGRQGRDFEEEVLEVIKDFRQNYPQMRTQTDGGINKQTLAKVKELGVDDAIVGSAIFRATDPSGSFKKLIEQEEEF